MLVSVLAFFFRDASALSPLTHIFQSLAKDVNEITVLGPGYLNERFRDNTGRVTLLISPISDGRSSKYFARRLTAVSKGSGGRSWKRAVIGK